MSRTRIAFKFVLALLLVAGFVYWFSRNAPAPRLPLQVGLTVGILLYAFVAYLLRPKVYNHAALQQRQRKRRRQHNVNSVRYILLPGKFLACAVIDFVWMLFGKTPNHDSLPTTLEE